MRSLFPALPLARPRLGAALRPLVLLSLLGAAGCGADESNSSPVHQLRERFPARAAEVLEGRETFVPAGDAFTLPPRDGEGTWRDVDVRIPRAGGDVILFQTAGGFELRVREIGARGEGELVENAVAHPREGGVSYWASAAGGVEEWLWLEPTAVRSDAPVAAWEIEGGAIEQRGEAIAVLDGDGAVRMTVTAPRAYAAGGREVAARLGARGSAIELWVEADGEEVLIDPQWSATSMMVTPRSGHVAARLQDGRVLVAGGINLNVLKTAEIYNPATNAWSATGSMSTARAIATATLLPNGKVLVTGGHPYDPGFTTFASAELYNPATGLWSSAGSMSQMRSSHRATLLASGKVLITGGTAPMGMLHKSADLYDPATNSWAPAAPMSVGRHSHEATLLADGRVLVAGGDDLVDDGKSIKSTEIYDPATNTWSPAAPMIIPRSLFSLVNLPNGKVLAFGLVDDFVNGPHGEVYDPAANTWTATGNMTTKGYYTRGVLLPNGKVLSAGGAMWNAPSLLAELYDPATNAWSAAPNMSSSRSSHTLTPLADGRVLAAGGGDWSDALVKSAEVYDPGPLGAALGAACAANAACQSGFCVDGVCCNAACNAGPCDACSIAAGADVNGTCKLLSGNACNDGNACTTNDTCQSGVCAAGAPLVCAPPDACHDPGTCNPATGVCDYPFNNNPGCGGPTCVTIQRGLFGAVFDTQLADNRPTKNYGTNIVVVAGDVNGGIRQSLLRFDLSPIPAGATVTSAVVTLSKESVYGADSPVEVHKVLAPWSEAGVTWDSFAGAFDPAVYASFSSGASDPTGKVGFDAAALVQAWLGGAPNHGVLLFEPGAMRYTDFASSEAIDVNRRPKLEVCYTVP